MAKVWCSRKCWLEFIVKHLLEFIVKFYVYEAIVAFSRVFTVKLFTDFCVYEIGCCIYEIGWCIYMVFLSNKWLMLVHICCIWKKIFEPCVAIFSKMIFKMIVTIWNLKIAKFNFQSIWKSWGSFLENILREFDSVVKLFEFRTILWIFEFKVGKILTCLKLKYLIWEFKIQLCGKLWLLNTHNLVLDWC